MQWFEAVDSLRPWVIKISTPTGTGSGFLLPWPSSSGLCAIATATHVVNHALTWDQPIRLEQVETGKSVLAKPEMRAFFFNVPHDTTVLVIETGSLEVPVNQFSFLPQDNYLKVGNEVGWLGFPAIANSMCFFSGRISAWLEQEKSYLIDGVAINGVSGGIVFSLQESQPMLIGVVSAYIPNRATGEALPGLAVVRDISHLHDQATNFASLDDARSAQPEAIPPVSNAEDVAPPELPTHAKG